MKTSVSPGQAAIEPQNQVTASRPAAQTTEKSRVGDPPALPVGDQSEVR